MTTENTAKGFVGYNQRSLQYRSSLPFEPDAYGSRDVHLQLRITSAMHADLQNFAAAEGGLSRSDAIRLAIQRGLNASRKGPR